MSRAINRTINNCVKTVNPNINELYAKNPTKMIRCVNALECLSINLEKNNIEMVHPIPPTISKSVYSNVVTSICFVAYVGNIGTNMPIAEPCKRYLEIAINVFL